MTYIIKKIKIKLPNITFLTIIIKWSNSQFLLNDNSKKNCTKKKKKLFHNFPTQQKKKTPCIFWPKLTKKKRNYLLGGELLSL